MKQIIVAIDFSRCSIHSLEYAITVANTMDANIIMTWVDISDRADTAFQGIENHPRKEIVHNFEELIQKYGKTLKGDLTYKIRKGKVHFEIANQAKYSDTMLVIAGTHGVSGFEEFWIGSNAYRIVSHAPCPVITVRSDFETTRSINTIVLPIDSSLESRQKLPFSTKMAKLFDSKVHIISLYSTSIKAIRNRIDNYTNQVETFLKEEGVQHIVKKVEAENITNATINYAKSVDADIISIMTEQETSSANLFLGAYAQQMVNHSPIPVLCIRTQ